MNLSEIPEKLFANGRVYLRLLTKKDAEALFYLVKSSRIFLKMWLPWVECWDSVWDAANYIEPYLIQKEMDNGALWGVFNSENNDLMGTICLQWVSWEHESSFIGYWMGESYTGQGYGSEALYLLCDFLFNSLKINRLELSIACENQSSLALAERLGFVREGLKRDFEKLRERFYDHYSLSLLARDFVYEGKRFKNFS